MKSEDNMIDYKVDEMKKILSEKIIDRIYYLNNIKEIYQKKEDKTKIQELELNISILRSELEKINLLSNDKLLEFLEHMEIYNHMYKILNEEDRLIVYNILKEFDDFCKLDGYSSIIEVKKKDKDISDKMLYANKSYERICSDMDIINSKEFMMLENAVQTNYILSIKGITNEDIRRMFKNDLDNILKEINRKSSKERVLYLQDKLYNDIKKHVRFMIALFLEQQNVTYNINDSIENLFCLVNEIYISRMKEMDSTKKTYTSLIMSANEMENRKIKALNKVSSEFVNSLKENNIDLFQYSAEDFINGISESNLYEEINNKKRISK